MSQTPNGEPGDGLSLPKLQLLPDSPALDSEDRFGHSAYADVLVDVLSADSQTLTVGLLGPWGIGKSTVLRQMAQRMRERDNAVVLFDAWRYDGPSLRRQMLRAIGRSVRDQGVIDERRFDVDERLRDFEVDSQRTSFRVRFSWGAAGVAMVQALIVVALVTAASRVSSVQDTVDRLELKNGTVLTLVLGGIVFAAGLVGASFRAIPETETTRRLEDPEAFQGAFADLVGAVTAPSLVVAIDNLDRSPAREALELLSTIKTFLEPAASDAAHGTHVYFVVAVDEHGLRRHLASAGDVSEEATEFLRKIFSATLRVAPLRSDDLREYVREQLAVIEDALQLTADETRQIALLVAAAFNRSPRQVVQFLNTLQLRLRLVRRRESGSHAPADGRLSASPLATAKLMLLEDRWPLHYERLCQQPHLLADWHAAARDGRGGALKNGEWSTLEPFLRLSEFVEVGDVRPYVSTKRSRLEETLPEYGAFRRAVTTADRDHAESIVGGNPSWVGEYVACIRTVFDSELDSGHVEAARAVLDVVLSVPILTNHATRPGTAMLDRGIRDPSFRRQLSYVAAEPLLCAGIEAAGWARAQVIADVAGRLRSDSSVSVREAALALAVVGPRIDSDGIGQIQGYISALTPARHLPELALLAASRPELVSGRPTNDIVEYLTGDPAALVGEATGGDARVLIETLMASPDGAAHLPRLFTIAAEALQRSVRDDSAFGTGVLLDLLDRAPEEALMRGGGELLRTLVECIPELEVGLREQAAGLAWRLAAHSGRAEAVGRLIEVTVSGDPSAQPVLRDRLARLDRPTMKQAVASLAERVAESGSDDGRLSLAELVSEISLPDLEVICAGWVAQGIGEREVDRLVPRLAHLPDLPKLRVAIDGRIQAARDNAETFWLLEMAVTADISTAVVTKAAEKALPLRFDGIDAAAFQVQDLVSAIHIATATRVSDAVVERMLAPLVRWVVATDDFASVIEILMPIQRRLSRDTRGLMRQGLLARVAMEPDDREVWASRFEQFTFVASDAERDQLARLTVETLHAAASVPFEGWLLSVVADLVADTDLFRMFLLEVEVIGSAERRGAVSELRDRSSAGSVALASNAGPPAGAVSMMRCLERGRLPVSVFVSEFGTSPASSTEFQQLLVGDYVTWDADSCGLTPRGIAVLAAL